MAVLSFLAILCMVICSCTPAPREETPLTANTVAGGWQIQGELTLDAGQISYSLNGEVRWREAMDGVEPYQVVTTSLPALVTSVDDRLDMTTHALASEARPYPGQFPLLADDGWALLAGLPAWDEVPAMQLRLLDSSGQTSWEHSSALALWPEATATGPDTLYAAKAGSFDHDTNPLIFPLGKTPELTAINPADGTELWSRPVPTDYPVADARLVALGRNFGLLCLQYDYLVFELAAFSTADGSVTGRFDLHGAPAERLVYPGPEGELIHAAVASGTAEVLVRVEGRGPVCWSIDLAAGTLAEKQPAGTGYAAREENDNRVGGAAAPGPGNHPFTQVLIPAAAGASWSIPALLNPEGRLVLLVKGEIRLLDIET